MNSSTLWGLLLYPVAAVQTYILFHPEKTWEFFVSASMSHLRNLLRIPRLHGP